MSELMKRSRGTITRRQFGTFSAASLLAAASGATVHAQINSTPPATSAGPTPLPAESVDDVASRLGYDIDAIFRFVRDDIAYEPYAGILRGANGTLWSRAGNAADQAELLGALLRASLFTVRFASGSLDANHQDALRTASSRSRDMVTDTWERAMLASVGFASDLPPDPPDNLDAVRKEGQGVVEDAIGTSDRLTGMIHSALDEAGIVLPEPGNILPDFEISRHAWVQVADGPDWIDFDPSLPDGMAPPDISSTMDDWPPEWHHQIVFAIEGEHLTAGALSRHQAASLTANSRALAGVPVLLGMTSPDALAGIGFAITEAVSGQVSAVPWLLANETTAIASTSLAFTLNADSAQSALGDSTLPDGECVAIWLVTTITSPDQVPRRIERALLNRIPAEDRAAGLIDPTRITPVPLGANGTDPDLMTRITLIHTELARTPPVAAIRRAESDPHLGALGAIGPMLTTMRDIVGGGVELDRGAWSFPSGPAITAFQLDPGDPNDPESPVSLHADLIHHERSVARIDGGEANDATHPLLQSGVLDAVSESLLLNPPGQDDLAIPRSGVNIARIFETVATEGIPVHAVRVATDLDALNLTPEARLRIEAAFAEGQVVVVPEQPVEIDGAPAMGWWIVDPLTGRTRDQLVDGTGGASDRLGRMRALSTIPEYGVLIENVVAVLEERLMCFLGGTVARAVLLAIAALAYTGGPESRVGAYLVGLGIGGGTVGSVFLLATC